MRTWPCQLLRTGYLLFAAGCLSAQEGPVPALTENAKLVASDGEVGDHFGSAVAISGDTIVIGAEDFGNGSFGVAYVFVMPVEGWSGILTEAAVLTASDAADDDDFGHSVAISGDVVVVGADQDDDGGAGSGSAYVFVKPAGGWSGVLTEDAKLTASDAESLDLFGFSLAISGDAIVVGAIFDDDLGNSSGSAYVFEMPGGGWSGSLNETAKLLPSGGALGDDFGGAVGISGNTVVAGARRVGDDVGAAYVFEEPEGGWTGTVNEVATLQASDGVAEDIFGNAVDISGDAIVVGARLDDDNGTDSGSAYVFLMPWGGWEGTLTENAKLLASDGTTTDVLADDVAISGDRILASAHQVGANTGAAYTFLKPGGGWNGTFNESNKLLPSDPEAGDIFSSDVAVSGGTMVVGAQNGDGLISDDTGAAYVFSIFEFSDGFED